MYVWSLSYSDKNGFAILLQERPLIRVLLEDALDTVCAALGHLFCGGGEWAWDVPLGYAKYDYLEGERYLENSLGAWFNLKYSKVLQWCEKGSKTKSVISITEDQAEEIDSEWTEYILDIFSGEE